jgi:hypothetical protein
MELSDFIFNDSCVTVMLSFYCAAIKGHFSEEKIKSDKNQN